MTVSRALAQLAAEGLVVTRPGAGAFRAVPRTAAARAGDTSWQEVALSADAATEAVPRTVDASGVLVTLAAPPAGVIEFNGGYLHPSLQPERAMADALARAGRRPGAWGRPPMEGLPELREWFARGIGGAITAADVLITAGGQQALTTALRALAPPGAPVLVESPTYPGHARHRPRGRTAPGPGPRGHRRRTPSSCSPTPSGRPGPGCSSASRCSRTRPERCSPRTGAARCCGSRGRRVRSSSRTTSCAGSVHADAGALPQAAGE